MLLLLLLLLARRGSPNWLGVLPILLAYLFIFLRTHNTNARARAPGLPREIGARRRAVSKPTHLSGGYVKMGQVLSNRGDVLPQAVRAFATLQDQCPPRARSKMEALLREDACAVGELIDTVDEEAARRGVDGAGAPGDAARRPARRAQDPVPRVAAASSRPLAACSASCASRCRRSCR